MVVHHVALVEAVQTGHRVLVDDEGRLPSLVAEETPPESDLLDLVAAEAFAAPRHRLARSEYVDVVTRRAGSPAADRRVPGVWTALAGWSPGDPVADAVRRLVGEPAHPLRPVWYSPDWLADTDAWVDAALAGAGLTRTGPTQLHKVWSISAVARIPTDAGPRWLKVAGGPFTTEASVTELLATRLPGLVPEVVAVDRGRGRLLLAPLPEPAGDDDAALRALAARYPRAQLASLGWLADLRAAGAADRASAGILRDWERLVTDGPDLDRLAPAEMVALRRVDVAALLSRLDACGLPDALVHGDLHLGNVAHDGAALRVFDWTDAAVGHPFIDVAHALKLRWSDDAPDPALVAAFTTPWREVYPEADVDLALELAARVDRVVTALAFDAIARHTEPASRWEMERWGVELLRRVVADAAAD